MKYNSIIIFWILSIILIAAAVSAQQLKEPAEDLIVEAINYEPKVLPSSLIEEQEVPIYVQLAAIPNTLLQDLKVRHVELDLLEQGEVGQNPTVNGTNEEVKKLYYKNHYYKKPPTYSFSDLGVLIIYLKRIPSEKDVPARIDLDFRTKVYYDAAIAREIGGNVMGRTIGEETETQMKSKLSDHAFGNNFYFRVKEITPEYTTFVFYTQNFDDVRQVTVRKGQTSGTVAVGAGRYDAFRVRVKDIIGPKAEAKINVEGKDYSVKADERILDTDWYIESYSLGNQNLFDGKPYIVLKNIKNQEYSVVLSTQENYKNIEKISTKLKEKLGLVPEFKGTLCKDPTACKLYEDAGLQEQFDTDVMKNALGKLIQDLPSLGLVSVTGEKLEKGALIKTKFAQNVYRVGDSFGEPVPCGGITKRCILRSVSDDGIYVDIPEERLGKCTARYSFVEEQKSLSCGADVELMKIVDNKQVTFDILMGSAEQSFSVSDFSIHLPVEKRAISLTPERIERQIQKTNAYIVKLDKSIGKLQSITESWTKVCLSTAALFTIQTFLKGGKDKVLAVEPDKKEGEKEAVELPDENAQRKDLAKYLGQADWQNFLYYGTAGGNFELKKFPTKNVEADAEGWAYVKGSVDPIFNLNHIVLIQKEGAAIDPATLQITELTDSKTHYYKLKLESGAYTPKEITSLNSCRMLKETSMVFFDGKGFVLPLTRASQLPAEEKITYSRTFSEGQQLFLVYDGKDKYIDVWSGGSDCLFKGIGGKSDGDEKIGSFRNDKWLEKILRDLGKAREENQNLNLGGAKFELNTRSIDAGKKLGCEQVLSPGQCRLLYNACDPVMCPPSRCDFDGVYRVDNVIQSGLIGSLMLCLPNSKDGVVAPVCLTGVLAALKNLRSVLQGYVNCLEQAGLEDKSVGICDRIRSIYVCEIIWKEAYSLLKLKGGILGFIFKSKSERGGTEYLENVQAKLDESKKFLSFFTQDYATSVFASYKGRSAKEIGTELCKSAVYGKYPIIGDILNEVSHLTDPVQYTAYVEEEPYSLTIQKNSRYQVFYHIYAGGQEVRYSVYLKKGDKKTLVKSLSKTAQGSIAPSAYVDENIDFIAESGYNEVCVKVNNDENCGFGKIVSSSFGMNSVNNYILNYELSKKITSESECRSESYGLLPNAAPQKVCAKFNPGDGAGQKEVQKWAKVGTCGTDTSGANLGDCWMKVGEIQNNPALLKEVSSKTCQNEGGVVCAYNEECKTPGRVLSNVDIPLQETEGKRVDLSNMVCCSKECTISEQYTKAEQLFTLLKQKLSPEEKSLFEKAAAYTEKECSFGNKEVFDGIQFEPEILYAPYKDTVKDLGKKKENNLHLFETLMFAKCGNCLKLDSSIENIKDADWQNDFGFKKEELTKTCKKETARVKYLNLGVKEGAIQANVDFEVQYTSAGEASISIKGIPGSYQVNRAVFDKIRLDVKPCTVQRILALPDPFTEPDQRLIEERPDEKVYSASQYDEEKCEFSNAILELDSKSIIKLDDAKIKIKFESTAPAALMKESRMKLGGDVYGNYETKMYPITYDINGNAVAEIEQGGLYKISEIVFEQKENAAKCTILKKYGRDPFEEPLESTEATATSCTFNAQVPITKDYTSEVRRTPISKDTTTFFITSGKEEHTLTIKNTEPIVQDGNILLCELQGLANEKLNFCLPKEKKGTSNDKCSDYYWDPEENRKAVFNSKYGTFTECFNKCRTNCKSTQEGSITDPVKAFFGS